MRTYAIKNNRYKKHKPIGYLYYDETDKTYSIKITNIPKKFRMPILFEKRVSDGIYELNKEESKKWVLSRLMPPDRQNIGLILRDMKLKYYDEIAFLEKHEGRCDMDDYKIVMVKRTP